MTNFLQLSVNNINHKISNCGLLKLSLYMYFSLILLPINCCFILLSPMFQSNPTVTPNKILTRISTISRIPYTKFFACQRPRIRSSLAACHYAHPAGINLPVVLLDKKEINKKKKKEKRKANA